MSITTGDGLSSGLMTSEIKQDGIDRNRQQFLTRTLAMNVNVMLEIVSYSPCAIWVLCCASPAAPACHVAMDIGFQHE